MQQVDIRLPVKVNSTSHGERPVHQMISMMKWIRTRTLSLSLQEVEVATADATARKKDLDALHTQVLKPSSLFESMSVGTVRARLR